MVIVCILGRVDLARFDTYWEDFVVYFLILPVGGGGGVRNIHFLTFPNFTLYRAPYLISMSLIDVVVVLDFIMKVTRIRDNFSWYPLIHSRSVGRNVVFLTLKMFDDLQTNLNLAIHTWP